MDTILRNPPKIIETKPCLLYLMLTSYMAENKPLAEMQGKAAYKTQSDRTLAEMQEKAVYKTQSGRTLRERELCSLDCPFFLLAM